MTGTGDFKRALEEEFALKSAEAKAVSDRFVSDRMFEARRETERKVHSIRTRHRKRYELLLEREKRRGLLLVREEALEKISSFLEEISKRVCERISMIRRDRVLYGRILAELVGEALDSLAEEAVVLVPPGEKDLISRDRRKIAVEESEEDTSWGGCLVTDAGTRSVFVDNTIKTRWDLFQKELVRDLSESYCHVLEGSEGSSRELRLP